MNKRVLRYVSAAVLALGVSATTTAAVPQLVNYQGILLDGSGSPITSTVNVTFTIWDAATGGTALWNETQPVTPDGTGRFDVLLGSNTAVPDVFSGDAFLGIQVASDPEMTPRQRIVSVGYSYRTGTVDGATGGTVTGPVSIQGDLTVSGRGTFGPSNNNVGNFSFAAGSNHNLTAEYATVGGGFGNSIWSSAGKATISGGDGNVAYGLRSTIGGGNNNTANGTGSTIAGGSTNTTDGVRAAILGGSLNSAPGDFAAVLGGKSNIAAGNYTLAAGLQAQAVHSGTFVWADATGTPIMSSANNQFVVRASGGIWLGTTSSPTTTAGRFIETSTGAYLSSGGTWTNASDRNLKENFTPVDGETLLERIAALPITRWNYKTDGPSITHIGPVAQDFYKLFAVGNDDVTISTIDPAGVALAAIQQLHRTTQKLEAKTDEIDQLKEQVNELRKTLEALTRRQ